MTENKLIPINSEMNDDTDWLECISAMDTDLGLLYFCDAKFGQFNKLLGETSEFKVNFPEGSYLYSVTAYNPLNRVSNRIVNELSNFELFKELHTLLPNCRTYHNFSYFPKRPYHFERGFTVQIPPNYTIDNHNDIVYGLAMKYQQAAYFRGRVLENGLTMPCIVLVQGEYREVEEKLVTIQKASSHPAFLHRANHAVFRDISELLRVLCQARDHIPVCTELCDIYLENFNPQTRGKHLIIAVEGLKAAEIAKSVSDVLNAEVCENTPVCLKDKRWKYEHSTILLAAYKTIANYLQASHIAKLSREKSVVTYKYWPNTVSSLIATEITKGQSNLPQKHHEVYSWPDDLLRPDVVVMVEPKGSKLKQSHHLKLKTTAMKRMKDSSWIVVKGVDSRPADYISSIVVDKLSNQGVPKTKPNETSNSTAKHQETISFQSSQAPDQQPHRLNTDHSSNLSLANMNAESVDNILIGKPFWW